MIRFLVFGIFVVLTNTIVVGQDLIIRITGDTIHCKIDKVDDSFVHYRKHNSGRSNSELISTREVFQLLYGVENTSAPLPKKIPSELKSPKFKLFGSIGFSRLLSNEDIQDQILKEYDSELRWGNTIDFGVSFILNKEWSMGFWYGNSKYSNDLGVVALVPISGGTPLVGNLNDNISINYYGANATYRVEQVESNNAFEIAFGIGYVNYVNDSELVYPINTSAAGLGIHGSVGYELSLGQGFAIPLRLGFKGFSVGDIKVRFSENTPIEFQQDILSAFEFNPNFNITRLELSVGLSLAL